MGNIPILQNIAIHSAQAIFLKEIARRGGEMEFSWERAREMGRDDVCGMVADLMQKQLVQYLEYVTSADQAKGRLVLKLTDIGRRVIVQLHDAEKKQQEVHSTEPERKIAGT